jgi:hypothetical protein
VTTGKDPSQVGNFVLSNDYGLSRSDRERDVPSEPTPIHSVETTTQTKKRPRIIRDRYPPSFAIAKKSLPIDPQAADRGRRQDER